MTELEKMQRAKIYIDKLANGVNPITNIELSGDTILNNVQLSRCFFYVSDILRQVIDNGGQINTKYYISDKEFYITEEQQKMLVPSNQDLYVKDITNLINSVTTLNDCKKFQYKWITSWLVSNGFLTEYTDELDKKTKKVTDTGKSIGLRNELRNGKYRDYIVTFYNHDAQAFIYDNLNSILTEK